MYFERKFEGCLMQGFCELCAGLTIFPRMDWQDAVCMGKHARVNAFGRERVVHHLTPQKIHLLTPLRFRL